jgi:hypothetical protein
LAAFKPTEGGENRRRKRLELFELPLEEQFCIFKMSAILKMTAKTRHKIWAVKIQHFSISSKFDMWVDNDVPN